MAAGHPWRLALLLAIAAATAPRGAAHSADAASRANGRRPLVAVAPALLTTDRDEPMRDDLYRSQPPPTLPHESTEPDLIAATAGRLAAALLRALAEPSPTATPNNAGGAAEAEDPWRGAARELAGDLLADGRLSALLQEPPVAAAMAWELRGLRCEAAAVDEQPPHPPQRPDSGGAPGGAPLLRQPPLSDEAAIDSLRAHAGAHVDEGDATARLPRQRPPLPHEKKQDESGGGGPLLRAPRSGASCAADGDCPLGQYCVSGGSCFRCSYISPTQCDDASGDCCSVAFRTQCPANPAGCCERDGDCSGGEVCSASRCTCSPACQKAQKAALLAAFVRDPRAAAAWGALWGWSNASEPCAGSWWEGVYCNDQRWVDRVDLRDRPELRFELGPAVGSLRYLNYLLLSGTGMFGTIPRELGSLTALQYLRLYNNPSLSGTIPRELGSLTALRELHLISNPSLSGTIPRELGNLTALAELHLYSNPSLSGTIPRELGSLTALQYLDLDSNPSLSGTIPRELGNLTALQELNLDSNPSLSGTIPHELGNLTALVYLWLYSNPSLSGTIPRELGNLTALQKLDMHSNLGLSGTLPALTDATSLISLIVDNCSLTGLPTSLPRSISHLYLNHNPIRANSSGLSTLLGSLDGSTLHVLDAGFSWPLQLGPFDSSDSGYGGTRVGNPSPCHIGARCEFTLHMYDQDNQPARVGGLVSGLRLRLNSSTETAMVDNRDGSFTASIPAGWIGSKGPQLFRFLDGDGVEFKPTKTADGMVVNVAGEDSLRTVEFLPRECPAGTHTVADDATGATCVCEKPEQFEPDAANTNSSSTLSCHRRCRPEESVSSDGGSCVCSGGNYDTNLHGTLLCSTNGWEDVHAKSIPAFTQAQETRREGGKCVACPSECTRCEDGAVTVLKGWRFNSTSTGELRSQLAAGKDGRPQWLYSCPYEKEDCPEIKLSAGAEQEEEDETLLCPSHHDGPLCATCEQGFSRRGSSDNKCEACSDMSGYIEAQFGLSAGWFSAVVAAIVAAVGGAAYVLRGQLLILKEAKTNLRILLGSAQVLSLLPSVL
eukprot:COSAG06_NODE_5045_length_3764_cov_12.821282_1_plen_1059_part_01